MPKRFGLAKTERLKSRKQIDALFANKAGFSVFPIRVLYRFTRGPEAPGVQIGVTASKRQFKKAVDRNRVKRLLREAYRLQKAALVQSVETSGQQAVVFFLFTDKALPTFEALNGAMANCIKKLSNLATREPLA